MDSYTPTPNYYDDYICHYGVKGMKWRYHKPKASPTNSDAYNKLAAMDDDRYNMLMSKIKLTRGGKGKSSTTSKKAKGSKASSEKKANSSKSSGTSASPQATTTTPDQKKKREEEEVKVEIRQPEDILEKIRKGYKAKKTRVRT